MVADLLTPRGAGNSLRTDVSSLGSMFADFSLGAVFESHQPAGNDKGSGGGEGAGDRQGWGGTKVPETLIHDDIPSQSIGKQPDLLAWFACSPVREPHASPNNEIDHAIGS